VIVQSANGIWAIQAMMPRMEVVEKPAVDVHPAVDPVLVRVEDERPKNDLEAMTKKR
jgi:hypothetical protein